MQETERQRLDARLKELRGVRSGFDVHWKDICEQILPYRPKWNVRSDTNTATSLNNSLVNSTPVRVLRTLSAGLMAGITSPSRQWFNLTTSDPALKEIHRVSVYLDEAEKILSEVLIKAQFYQALADGVYPDLGLIGTAVIFAEEDEETEVRFESLPIGEFYLDVDKRGDVDTCFRVRGMTVRQVVQKFGLSKVCATTKSAFDQGNYSQVVEVVHAVFPNEDWTPGRALKTKAQWASKWWETNDDRPDSFLREGGYDEFPALAPRWNVRAGEAYGRGSPGWEARGDCKALQHLEKNLAKLVDKSADPPLKASNPLKQARPSLLPGDVTYGVSPNASMLEPIMQVHPSSIMAVEQHIQRHETRIERAFFVDLWMALLHDDRAQRATATEVEATRQEVMLQLGPLLENLNNGLLEPAIERTYAILQRNGVLPDPPPELEGTEITVDFISVLHQAQQMTGLTGIRELVRSVMELVQAGKSNALDKLDEDGIVDELVTILGVPAKLVMSEDEVEKMRRAKAEQAQAAQQGEAMLKMTEGAKNLSAADPAKLKELGGMLPPAAAAQGGIPQ